MTTTRIQAMLILLTLASATGCSTVRKHGTPMCEVPPHWLAAPKACQRPIDFTMLQKEPYVEHIVGVGDVLGVYVEGIISGKEISSGRSELPEARYYSRDLPETFEAWPAVGQPLTVQADGTVHVPLISPVPVIGLTLQQAADRIRAAFIDAQLLENDLGKSFAQVSLIRPRVNRVLVVREDTPSPSTELIQRDQYVLSKRGEAAVVQLVLQESDLLHALVATGGLPGEDANNEVWILRGASSSSWQETTRQFDEGVGPEQIACAGRHVVIPLRHNCQQPLPFGRADIVLEDGDIVFVEKRIESHFYTGGLLNAGRIPLPRDEDIDILEAIALANNGALGLSGQIGIGQQGQFSRGPGNYFSPTRAQVIRKLPGDEQVIIEIDVSQAMVDVRERILIQPDDFIMLHYRPRELAGNFALNFFDFGFVFSKGL